MKFTLKDYQANGRAMRSTRKSQSRIRGLAEFSDLA